MTRLSTRESRLVLLIALAGLVLRLGLIFRSEALIYSRPYFDDTFYSVGCAYHLATGLGLTSDGVHPTNGVQPLIVLLDVPLFEIAGADKLFGLRLTILLQALIDTISIWLIALMVARVRKAPDPDIPAWRSAPVLVALSWACLFNVFRQTMNGLETGLYSMVILVTLLLYHELRESDNPPLWRWFLLGATLGILVLSRIDGIFIIGGVIVAELWRKRGASIKPLFVMGMTWIIVSSPWWIFNYVRFGSFMPMSGQSEALGINYGASVFDAVIAFADIITNFFYFPFQSLPVWTRWLYGVFVPVGVFLLFARLRLFKSIRERYNIAAFAPLTISAVGFILFYVFFFAAWWFIHRYFQPLRILWMMIFAIGMSEAFARVSRLAGAKRTLMIGIVSVFLALAMSWNVFRYLEYYRNNKIAPGYLIGKWAQEHPNVLIGMEQAGTSRFLSPNIVNLDGKVNPEALVARKHGAIGQYVVQKRFDYIMDWSFIAQPIVALAKKAGSTYVYDGKIGTMEVYKRAD